MKITVAGLGYVGMSLAVLLAKHNKVVALDIDETRVGQVNRRQSPIEDTEIPAGQGCVENPAGHQRRAG